MKQMGSIVLAGCLLAGLLTGCGETRKSQSPGPVETEILTLEITPEPGDPMEQLRQLTALETTLQEVLARHGAEVETVTLTLGTAPAATVQALTEGGVDVALFPAETLAEVPEGAAEVLASEGGKETKLHSWDPADWYGKKNRWVETPEGVPGQRALIVAGPSAYGRNLAGRIQAGKTPTWKEWQKAVWGLAGGREEAAASQWMGEQWEGNTLAALPHQVDCASTDALLASLAAEEVDVIVLLADARIDAAERWTADSGLGRPDSIWKETTVLAVTEPIYGVTAAVGMESPWQKEEGLRKALTAALLELAQEEAFQRLAGVSQLAETPEWDLASLGKPS